MFLSSFWMEEKPRTEASDLNSRIGGGREAIFISQEVVSGIVFGITRSQLVSFGTLSY